MAIPTKSRKGLQSINTHTDRTLRVSRPHRAYMRISAIEMEKTRRMTEKDSILERLSQIDRRVTYLNQEKDRLLRNLGERSTKTPSGKRPVPRGARPSGQTRGARNTNAGAGRRAHKKSPRIPGASDASRKTPHTGRPGPAPLKPLPEWTGTGLRIKY